MQPLTAAPRSQFTETQIRALLTSVDLAVDFGVELLDASLALLEDISADVSGGTVHRSNYADVHSTVELTVSRELAWGRDRIMPYMVLSSVTAGVTGCRWNLGVYLLMTPDRQIEQDPPTYQVTGYDQLHLLQGHGEGSFHVVGGWKVLDSVRLALVSAWNVGVGAPVLLDSSAEAKTFASTMVWATLQGGGDAVWLKVVNDELATVGYRGIWCDQDGNFRSGPYVQPEDRPSEWRLDVGDLVTGIVAQDRPVVNDVWGVPNWMRVVRNGMESFPLEGDGRHTMTNPDKGLSSIASVGRIVRGPVVYLDAATQADLVTQGERLFAAATRVSEVITLKLSPFPALWHFDRLTYVDAALGADREVQVRSWDLPLNGGDMQVVVETVS